MPTRNTKKRDKAKGKPTPSPLETLNSSTSTNPTLTSALGAIPLLQPTTTATMNFSNLPHLTRSSPDVPPADLHSKLAASSPPRGKTKRRSNIQQVAAGSSKVLQQVLGLQPPEPYARPVPMSGGLEMRFRMGVREFWEDGGAMGEGKSVEGELGKMMSRKIGEEMTMNMPVWLPDLHDETGRDPTIPDGLQDLGSHSRAQADIYQQAPARLGNVPSSSYSYGAGSANFSSDDIAYNSYVGFGSETTAPGSEWSQPEASSVNNTGPSTTAHQAQMPSFTSTNDSINYDCLGVGARLTKEGTEIYYDDADADALDPPNTSQRVQSAPLTLFPPSRVEDLEAWDFGLPKMDSADVTAPGPPTNDSNASTSVTQDPVQYFNKPAPAPPQIKIQEPSPEKQSTSKKRSATHSISMPPAAKSRDSDSTMGLPVLAAEDELLWKTKFPGNTYALLTLLLAWSLSMQRMEKLLPDPYLFSLNPAFPSPIKPPVHQPLISVAFYDTSTVPHKEIRFIGPSDVAKCSYNEVSVFRPTTAALDFKQAEHECRIAAMRRALGLEAKPLHLNNGEGRWAYVLMQGHAKPSETIPHVVVAWHVDAVTSKTECLHTIYPDVCMAENPAPPVPGRVPRRVSSLHNELRAASSSDVLGQGAGNGALTLRREVWKMEKAGSLPLIEGCRVDVKTWEGWLGAVGMGKGKVVVWKERM